MKLINFFKHKKMIFRHLANLLMISFLLNFKLNGFSQQLKTIKIGNQVWCTENISLNLFSNGDTIKQVNNKDEWILSGQNHQPAWCYHKFDSINKSYGKLYNYYVLSDNRKIAPVGWRVPSLEDYYVLVNFIDPLCTRKYFSENGSLAGGSLKSKDSIYWNGLTCPQITSDFNAIAGGGFRPSVDYPEYDWITLRENAMFWCLTDWDALYDFVPDSKIEKFKSNLNTGKFKDKAIVIRLDKNDCNVDLDDDPTFYGYSLRLIKE